MPKAYVGLTWLDRPSCWVQRIFRLHVLAVQFLLASYRGIKQELIVEVVLLHHVRSEVIYVAASKNPKRFICRETASYVMKVMA
jgi:hypothetical protein